MDVDHKELEIRAHRVLDEYGITKPVVDVSKIAAGEGVKIVETEMPSMYKNVAGFYDEKRKTIFIAKNDEPHRKLFSVAHELGHIILNHRHATVQFRITHSDERYPKEESEANSFAVHLLVPEFMLREYMEKYSLSKFDYEELAKIFGVSFTTMRHALSRLN